MKTDIHYQREQACLIQLKAEFDKWKIPRGLSNLSDVVMETFDQFLGNIPKDSREFKFKFTKGSDKDYNNDRTLWQFRRGRKGKGAVLYFKSCWSNRFRQHAVSDFDEPTLDFFLRAGCFDKEQKQLIGDFVRLYKSVQDNGDSDDYESHYSKQIGKQVPCKLYKVRRLVWQDPFSDTDSVKEKDILEVKLTPSREYKLNVVFSLENQSENDPIVKIEVKDRGQNIHGRMAYSHTLDLSSHLINVKCNDEQDEMTDSDIDGNKVILFSDLLETCPSFMDICHKELDVRVRLFNEIEEFKNKYAHRLIAMGKF
jgi:hypothetical protein